MIINKCYYCEYSLGGECDVNWNALEFDRVEYRKVDKACDEAEITYYKKRGIKCI